ncbi:MAG TPA: aminotransferase class I/II-fold pyridoxal phosphate-dependent enzyme [Casimicrobium sp.]|nr:aminotransferase class I/II-fold pyridoxal phosphate-dependent enzyme [Casimicrobium sp.]
MGDVLDRTQDLAMSDGGSYAREQQLRNARRDGVLAGSTRDFLNTQARTATERAEAFWQWNRKRIEHGMFAYGKALATAPTAHASLRYLDGRVMSGLNFSSQDYLSLASHQQVHAAAIEAINRLGVHSAGSTALAGNVVDGNVLEHELASWLHTPHVALFPTGWAAGYGVIRGLMRAQDHVVIDVLAHNCLQEGAHAATRNVHLYRHLDVEHARKQLQRIRDKDSSNAILLVTEGIFSMDADSPDINALQSLAHEFGAMLLVDVAHDLGCSGPDGTGQIGVQGMLGKVDLVMGAFSKSFASNGGFVATHSHAIKEYLRYYAPPNTFSNALSPAQIATVRECIKIIRSDEGQTRRDALFDAVGALRSHLRALGITVMGQPSPIVPVLLGREDVARITSALIAERGVLTNLVEYPAVSNNNARLRMQVMSQHTAEQCATAAGIISQAWAEAKTLAERLDGDSQHAYECAPNA